MTLIEPKFGPWGPDPTPKVGLIWSYFLDFTWIPKLDQYFGYTNPFLDPKVSPHPNLDPQGGPSESEIGSGLALRAKNWVGIIKKLDQIQVQANNLGKTPNLNPLLGVDQAPRVQIWIQSRSCWPSDSEVHRILQFQAVSVIFNQQ